MAVRFSTRKFAIECLEILFPDARVQQKKRAISHKRSECFFALFCTLKCVFIDELNEVQRKDIDVPN